MQKVVGSSPIIRFYTTLAAAGVVVFPGVAGAQLQSPRIILAAHCCPMGTLHERPWPLCFVLVKAHRARVDTSAKPGCVVAYLTSGSRPGEDLTARS